MPIEMSGHSGDAQANAGSQPLRPEYGTATQRGVRARLNAVERRIRARSDSRHSTQASQASTTENNDPTKD